jgi:hypothetical protein
MPYCVTYVPGILCNLCPGKLTVLLYRAIFHSLCHALMQGQEAGNPRVRVALSAVSNQCNPEREDSIHFDPLNQFQTLHIDNIDFIVNG